MKRIIASVVLMAMTMTAAGFLAARAQSTDNKGPATRAEGDAAGQEVRQLEQQLRQASLKGDAAFFEKYWAEDYVRTNSFGVRLGKEEALTNYKSGVLKYKQFDFDDERIQAYGNTVIVAARVTLKGKYEENQLDGVFRHTRVWVKFPDGWKVVAYHASRVEDPEG